jgi:cell shape-determining protein MreD
MKLVKRLTLIILCLASAALLQVVVAAFLIQFGAQTFTESGLKFAVLVELALVPWIYGRYLLPFTALGVYWFLKKTLPEQEDVEREGQA